MTKLVFVATAGRYPFLATKKSDVHKLPTAFLCGLIDAHGAENVLLLAQSVKSESSPIRVHVNEMMNLKNKDGT